MPKLGSSSRGFAAAFALLSMLSTSSRAPALDLNLSIDSRAGVVTLNGWSRRVAADTGTIFYSCQEDFCGRGSTVSMRKQPRAGPLDADAMRRNELRIGDAIRERAKGAIARVDIGEPLVTKDGVFALGEITRTIVPAAGANAGLHLYWKSGYIAAPAGIHTLASSADSRQNSDENYNLFKFALMLMGMRPDGPK